MRGNIVASVGAVVVSVGVPLVSVSLIIGAVGLVGYGIWTIVRAVMLYASSVQLGLGPGIQRFIAVSHGEGREAEVVSVLWAAFAIHTALGAIALVATQIFASPFLSLFEIPPELEQDAVTLLRLVGVAMLLNLQAAALVYVQQGLERFGATALSSAMSSLGFLIAVVVLVEPEGLRGLGYAAVVQQVLWLAVAALTLRKVIFARRPTLLPWRKSRTLIGFSLKLQIAGISTLFNTQTDRLIIGLIAPVRTVGQFGVGAQIAETLRLLGGGAVTPLVSRMSVVRARGEEEVARLYQRISEIWIPTIGGVTIIFSIALYPLVAAWLGDGYGEAALFGTPLVVAYGFYLATGSGIAYLRASGQPGLEMRYGFMVVALNLVLTVVLAVLAGPAGVVIATLLAFVAGTAWFFYRLELLTPVPALADPRRLLRTAGAAALGGVCALGLGLVTIDLVPAPIALLPTALITGAVLLALMTWSGALGREFRSAAT